MLHAENIRQRLKYVERMNRQHNKKHLPKIRLLRELVFVVVDDRTSGVRGSVPALLLQFGSIVVQLK